MNKDNYVMDKIREHFNEKYNIGDYIELGGLSYKIYEKNKSDLDVCYKIAEDNPFSISISCYDYDLLFYLHKICHIEFLESLYNNKFLRSLGDVIILDKNSDKKYKIIKSAILQKTNETIYTIAPDTMNIFSTLINTHTITQKELCHDFEFNAKSKNYPIVSNFKIQKKSSLSDFLNNIT